uniref:K Homology domain-containing protein n=1 Tax=Panagrolaimus sp. PS1159 TaxID=55785 RepID=A0AC35ERX3_9BILA
MNVLNSLTYEVNGRIYRRNAPMDMNRGSNLRGNVDQIGDEILDEKPRPSDPITKEEQERHPEKEEEENHYNIIFNAKKRAYMTDIFVPEGLLGKLIGTKGSTKRQIEEETNSKIDIPRRGDPGPVIIASKKEEDAQRCYDRIEMIVLEGRRRLPFTHFVMIPCNSEEIMTKHGEFVEKMLFGDIHESCREPALYMPPAKLHLTIVPLWLFSEKDAKKAGKILKAAIEDFKKKETATIKMTIKGLSHMGDEDVDAVKVVYAKVQSDLAQKLANHLSNAFVKAGLTEKPRGGTVKLHMTIINTRYLGSEKPEKDFIDATDLLKKFGNIEYGTINVDKIQICSMGEVDTNTGGYHIVYSEKF